jgi:hypothetical protein
VRALSTALLLLTLAGCSSGGTAGNSLVDNFRLRTGIVAETPKSVIVRYNTLSSSLAEATELAEAHCKAHGRDAVLQQTMRANDMVADVNYLCM